MSVRPGFPLPYLNEFMEDVIAEEGNLTTPHPITLSSQCRWRILICSHFYRFPRMWGGLDSSANVAREPSVRCKWRQNNAQNRNITYSVLHDHERTIRISVTSSKVHEWVISCGQGTDRINKVWTRNAEAGQTDTREEAKLSGTSTKKAIRRNFQANLYYQ